MKLKVVFLGLLLPMAMLLSACGESGSVVTTTTAPPTTTTTLETTTTVEITTIETTTTATRTTSTVTMRTTLSKCKDTTTPKFTTTTTAATIATTTTTVEPVTVVTTTTTTKLLLTTRPPTTKPGYVASVVPNPFNEEELRTDLRLVLTIVPSPVSEGKEMNIQIENLINDVATIDMAWAVLKKEENGNWDYVHIKETVDPRYIGVGKSYETSLSFAMHNGPYRWMKLTDEELEPGEYKLIWAVEGGWIGADFTVE